jgi:hypothetical protein
LATTVQFGSTTGVVGLEVLSHQRRRICAWHDVDQIMHLRRMAVVALGGILFTVWLLLVWQAASERHDPMPPRDQWLRQALFEELQPVSLRNCVLERFGEPNDGGYLMCGNLLDAVEAGYSYGISGYDGWGCDISRRFRVTVHQYDCFDTRQPACPGGDMVFHSECVADAPKTAEGRVFDTLQDQITRNGDQAKRLVMKMDVEAAEWDTFIWTPNAVLDRVDQLAVEFHGIDEVRFVVAIQKLKELFYVVHLHFNNFSCGGGFGPFPSNVYEVLLVSKRLGELDPSGTPMQPHALDMPNNPQLRDCQARD